MSIRISNLKWSRKTKPQVYVRNETVDVVIKANGGVSRRHFSIHSANGKKALSILEQNNMIDRQIDAMSRYWTENYSGLVPSAFKNPIVKKSLVGMDNDFFKSTRQECNQLETKTSYVYLGIHFRSKNELIIAELLTEMGLKFKYEPRLVLPDGTEVYPDFLINIEEADRCFILEMQGMMNDMNYAVRAAQKESHYISSGFRDGKDILFFKAGNGSIDFDVLRTLIEAVVEANIKEAFGLS